MNLHKRSLSSSGHYKCLEDETAPLRRERKVEPTVDSMVFAADSDHDMMILTSEPNDMPEGAKEMPYQGQNFYHAEWKQLFEGKFYLENLRSLGLKGKLRSCRFRSVCWRIYLECLPEDPDDWMPKTQLLREKYETVKNNLITNPRSDGNVLDLTLNNPLSQEEKSPWNQYFQDSELKITIQQDVIRTFPEIEFFHTPEIQTMMVNILFCYAREYPHICYRQGMHELLAPIIFVLHSDQQAYLHASELEFLNNFEPSVREEIGILLDPTYIEHDAFFIFCQIMEVVEGWYVMNEFTSNKYMDQFILAPFSRPPDTGPSSIIGVKLVKIHEQLLRRHDPDLFTHLELLEIVPQIYGIRWLRLLFGREFSIQDLLVIWDAIFANSLSFDLVDYIFTAMLIFIRELLLSNDYTTCLSHLMRYPAVADVHYITDLALHLKDPLNYMQPVGYSVHMLQHVPMVGGRQDIHRAPVKNGYTDTQCNMKGSPKKGTASRWGTTRPKTLAIGSVAKKSVAHIKPSSEPASLESSSSPEEVINTTLLPYASVKPTRETFQHHLRRPSDSVTQLVSQGVMDFHHAGSSHHESSTMPRKTKHNLEPDHYGLRKSGLSQSLGHLDKGIENSTDASCREMVPLPRYHGIHSHVTNAECSQRRSIRHSVKDKEEEMKQLRAEISELHAMSEYCWKRMSRHLDSLQECMVHQRLQHEDEMLLALAGLKRVRDILKGTVSFTQEVTEDEEPSGLIASCESANGTFGEKLEDFELVTDPDSEATQLDSYVVVAKDMCSRQGSAGESEISHENARESHGNCEKDNMEMKKADTSANLGSSLVAARREIRKFFQRTPFRPENGSGSTHTAAP